MGSTRGIELQTTPPASDNVTDYDLALANHYLRLLAAEEDGAHWSEAVCHIFGLDWEADREGARAIHAAHLARARWMAEVGFLELLRRDQCDEQRKPPPEPDN
jgi:hypothetical protein